MPTALVTGATAGLGWVFAQRLAASGHDLVLVARDEARLDERAATLRSEHGIRAETLAADLSVQSEVERVAERLRSDENPVDVLVNNAGFGLGSSFLRSDIADELRLLDVLCRSLVITCHAAAPAMVARGRGAILNVSSVAGFAPQGTYSAAKAWVTSFTQSLAADLQDTGVRVTAVCPGFTRTEFHERADLEMQRVPSLAWLSAEQVVDTALADLRRGTVVSVPSRRYKAAVAGLRLMPAPVLRGVSKLTRWGD